MKRLRYAWKAQVTWLWVVPAAILTVMTLLLFGDAFRPFRAPRTPADLAVILEVALPLALAMLMAAIPSLERDAGVAELHLSYREPASLRMLQLLAIPLLLWAAAAAAIAAVAYAWYAAFPVADVARMAVPPALGLSGAALAGGALARHQLGGVLAAGLWWGIDLQAHGEINRWLYLFNAYYPVKDLDPADMRRNALLLAAAGLALALALAERRERWVTS